MSFWAPTLLVMAGYVLTLVGLGIAFSRYSASTDAIYRAENLVPWWIAGLSQFMASHSAYMFVVVGGMLFTHGTFGLLWFALMNPTIMALVSFCFGRRWHRTGVSTPVEYLEARFGPGVRQFYAWLGLIVRPFSNGVRIAAFGMVMAAAMGFDPQAAVAAGLSAPAWIALIGMALVVTYTLMGGLMGAVVADAVQFVILEAALVALCAISLRHSGGVGPLLSRAPAGYLALPGWRDPNWLWLGGWVILQFGDTSAGQLGLITRFLCTPTDREARKVGYLAAAMYVPLLPLIGIPVMLAREMNPGLAGEASFGWISRELLPPGLAALMIAALFSATLATLSAELNTLSGILTLDVYRRRLRPDASDRQTVRFGRGATLLLAAVISGVALAVLGGGSTIIRATQEISSLIVAPMAVGLLGGLFAARAGQRSVYWAVFLGIGASLAARLTGGALGWSDRYLVLWQNGGAALVSLGVLWLGGRALSGAPSPAAAALIRRLREGDARRPRPVGGFPAPLPLIGWGVVAMAVAMAGALSFPASRDARTGGTAVVLGVVGLGLVLLGRVVRVTGQKG